MSLHMGIGVSDHADVAVAGREAAAQMISHLDGRSPGLVLVFCSARFADVRMLRAVRSRTGQAPLVGCTDAGGITTSGPQRRSVTVIGWLSDQCTFAAAVERRLSEHPRLSGERLSASLMNQATQTPRCLLVFPDGLTASGSELAAGLEKNLNPQVVVAGGSAADDLYYQKTFQFYNDEVLTDSVAGVLLCGSLKVGIGVRHGWVPVGRPRQVTHASGAVVHQLDGRPAISIYEDFLGLTRSELTEDMLAKVALTYPLGTEVRGQPEYVLRDAIRADRDGALLCTGNISKGTSVRLMIGGYESALEAAQQSAGDALEQLGNAPLAGALVFCSVARQKMLGSEFQGEIDVIRDALGGARIRLGGFYSYGELAPAGRTRGGAEKAPPLFHNESVVVLAFS